MKFWSPCQLKIGSWITQSRDIQWCRALCEYSHTKTKESRGYIEPRGTLTDDDTKTSKKNNTNEIIIIIEVYMIKIIHTFISI